MAQRHRLDLNVDIGEGMPCDEALLAVVTSANVACGYHAGDANTMAATVAAAVRHGVGIGAHPGLPDRDGFGRREIAMTPEQIYNLTIYQIGAQAAFAAAAGRHVEHVKPHGALSHMAERDAVVADAIARAMRDAVPNAFLVGLAGGRLIEAGRAAGLRIAAEIFADRAYRADGNLVPRTESGSMIDDPNAAAQRIVRWATEGTLDTVNGRAIELEADTVCVHGDQPTALAMAQAVRRALEEAGIAVVRMGAP